ncbi:hypothetical protein FRB93_004289 [Tulasnella sp. JGI-2019a]|nr:hypothetical protein FRB93_004289 [Tulasnella sp. JGI-2019a]
MDTLTRVLEPYEWARFDYLSRRTREVTSCDLRHLSDSTYHLLYRSLELRGERCLIPSAIDTIHRLKVKLQSTAQMAILSSLINPCLKVLELEVYRSAEVDWDFDKISRFLNGCGLVCLQSLTLGFGSPHPPRPCTMDPATLINFLNQNPSLKYVALELPILATTVMQGLGRLSRLDTLIMQRWKDPDNTGTEAMDTPESYGCLFPSLRHISSDRISTFRHLLSYTSAHHITSLQISVSSYTAAQELFGKIQQCTSLKSLSITPQIFPMPSTTPTVTRYPWPLDTALSFDPILACKAMESFQLYALDIIPPSDTDLMSISEAWANLSTFTWSLSSFYPRATMIGLSALSANCRKLRKLCVPLQVGPELLDLTIYERFCDGIKVDVWEWRVDNRQALVGGLTALAPLQWSKDKTPWLFTRGEWAAAWDVVADMFGSC